MWSTPTPKASWASREVKIQSRYSSPKYKTKSNVLHDDDDVGDRNIFRHLLQDESKEEKETFPFWFVLFVVVVRRSRFRPSTWPPYDTIERTKMEVKSGWV